MSRFRHRLRRARVTILVNLCVVFFYATEGTHYTRAWAAVRAETARLEEISERTGIPMERLRPQRPGLVERVRDLVVDPEARRRAEQQARLDEVLRKHDEQMAANPYRERIEAVQRAAQPTEIEALLRDLSRLGSLEGARLPELSRRALLRSALRAQDDDAFTLPPLPEGLPSEAYARQQAMQARLDALAGRVRSAVAGPDPMPGQGSGRAAAESGGEPRAGTRAPTGAAPPASVSRRIASLAGALGGDVRVRGRGRPGPRFAERPFPVQRLERQAPVVAAPSTPPAEVPVTPARLAGARTPTAGDAGPQRALASSAAPLAGSAAASGGGPAPEIAALAASLDNSPARIFRWVHDTIEYDPKWGQVRSPRGTLLERRGTSWDQAALLCELLIAAGVPAVLEWGEIEIPADLLLALTGTVDPSDAGGVLATGGVPIVLQQIASQAVTARLDHVWVKAQLDYLPNRGVDPVTAATVPDTWVRMDPSLKRYAYTPGIDVARNVPFALGTYLQSGTPLSPRRFYDEVLWQYIRDNGITCTTLEQLKKAGSIVAEAFPYVPGTLRGKVLAVDGEDVAVPAAFRHRIRLAVTDAVGSELVSWESAFADVWGQRVEIAYPGATAADDATIASFGDLFDTPPYLVDVKPVVKVAGAVVAEGSPIGAARETEVRLTITETSGFVSPVSHETLAGEHHVLALDFGRLPQEILDERQALLAAALAAGDSFEAEAETLFLLGATYLANLGRDLDDLSGWTWQRIVKLGTEGLVSQRGDVTTTLGGTPLSFRRAERDVDFAKMTLGVFPADGDDGFKISSFELMGAQGSYLEGGVFAQVLRREGIAAVSALTRSQREGQALALVDSSNVGTILAQTDLGAAAEEAIRFAVSQGKVAWVAERPITVNQWTGTGYVLADPRTGAAGYLISGGLAGGSDTGELDEILDALGSESWLVSLIRELVRFFFGGSPDSSSQGGPASNQGDPVNMATGNLWFTEPDLVVIARGPGIAWTRTYNSRSTYDGPLGYGWTFSYGEHLEELPGGSVLYRESDGTEHRFAPDGAGGYERPDGKHLTLTRGAEFTLRSKHGMTSVFALDGRLQSISDPNGDTVTLGYDAGGALRTVSDAAGRTVLTVTTVGGRITEVVDLSGRSVSYSYTGGDLTEANDVAGEPWSYAYDAGHNLVAKTGPLGNTHSWAFDGLDRCISHTDPLGNTERFAYGDRSAVLTDARGHDTYLEFDERGRATLEVDALGNARSSEWDADNNRTSITDPRGGQTARIFDGDGNLLAETDPLQNTTSFTYDPVYSFPATIEDPTGSTLTLSYDGNGNVTERSRVVGGTTLVESFRYDANGLLEEREDARGNLTSFSWDLDKGSLDSTTNERLETTGFTSDDLGRTITVTEPNRPARSVGWDPRNRVASVVDDFGNQITLDYDARGLVVEAVAPGGVFSIDYDAVGRVIAETDLLGNVSRREYDAAGNVTARVDARGNRTLFFYDAIGRPMASVDALGNAWTWGYCAGVGAAAGAGRFFCTATDPLGNTTTQEFDEFGRITKRVDPLGNETDLGYDELGRVESILDPLDRETRFEYDEEGRVIARVDPDGARTEFSYDAHGNLTTILDAELHAWQRTYDELNRLETETTPLGQTTTYAYDDLGNLISKATANSDVITYEYDGRRQTAIVLPGGVREEFGYDPRGRRTSIQSGEISLQLQYDDLNRPTQANNQTLGRSVGYSYDENGNLREMVLPEGTVQYFYDAENRLVEQRDPVTGVYRYAYDALDRRTELRYPNGAASAYEYDAAGRLTSLVTRDGQGAVVDGYRYTYDDAGQRTARTALHSGVTESYQYDLAGRLERWDRDASRFEEYAYDGVGRRTNLTDELGTISYTHDDANRLLTALRTLDAGGTELTSYSWDDNGNMTQRSVGGAVTDYSWDARDRLQQLDGPGGSTSYGYDPFRIRVRETDDQGSRRFLHAREDVVGTYDESGAPIEYLAHGPSFDEPLAQRDTGSTTSYLHRDALGSITAATDAGAGLRSQTDYLPFGPVAASSGPAPRHGYGGRELDPSGLMYLRARYYDPPTGRFLGSDPLRRDERSVAGLNEYSYVRNNPVSMVDPTGLLEARARIQAFTYIIVVTAWGFLGSDVMQLGADGAVVDMVQVLTMFWGFGFSLLWWIPVSYTITSLPVEGFPADATELSAAWFTGLTAYVDIAAATPFFGGAFTFVAWDVSSGVNALPRSAGDILTFGLDFGVVVAAPWASFSIAF